MNRIEPDDFFTNSPPARIIGTEVEYTINPKKIADMKGVLPYIIGSMHDDFASNGARIYEDVSHLEYASAEALGPLDAAATDHAGKSIVQTAFELVEDTDHADRPPLRCSGTYDIRDNTVYTKGYHENYMFPTLEVDTMRLLMDTLSAHIATRALWYGGGLAYDSGYSLSQKGKGIGAAIGYGYGSRTTIGKKSLAGILGGRMNGEKLQQEWSLLVIRHADPHMLPHATYLGLATTSLVLRLIEQGVIGVHNVEEYALLEPVATAHTTDALLTNSHSSSKIKLKNSHSTSPLEIQKRLAKASYDMCNEGDVKLPEDEQLAAEQWLRLVHDVEQSLSSRNLSLLFGRVEWATKLHILQQRGVSGCGTDIRAVQIDQNWAMLSPESISELVAKRMLARNEEARTIQTLADSYVTSPPKTRTAIRGSLIADNPSADWRICRVSWSGVDIIPKNQPWTYEYIPLSDPYAHIPCDDY